MKKLIVMATVGLLIMASTAFAKEVDQSKKAGQSEKAYNCTDTSGVEGTGGIFNLTVSNTPPEININYPPDKTRIYTDHVLLNFTLNDTENDSLHVRIYAVSNLFSFMVSKITSRISFFE